MHVCILDRDITLEAEPWNFWNDLQPPASRGWNNARNPFIKADLGWSGNGIRDCQRNIQPTDCLVTPGFQGVTGCTGGECDFSKYMLQTALMVFFTCSQKCMLRYVVRVILLKLGLKDKSSLMSLEGNKSLVSRTFKEQNHISCNVFSEAPSGIVSGGQVALAAVLTGCTSLGSWTGSQSS